MQPPHASNADLVRFIWIFSTATVILMALLALTWGLAMVHVYRRDGRRQRERLCLKCGYDLRETTTICPECGEPVRGHKPH